jgi:hypothetical protein
MTTTILWDIDGPLNPHLATDLIERNFTKVDEGYASWYIDTNHHAEWLRHLESMTTKMMWCSSWLDESNALVKHYGLKNRMPFIDLYSAVKTDSTMWKLPAVKEAFKGTRTPLIWLDDEFEESAYAWAQERGNTMLVTCDPAVGWTLEQYQLMQQFIRTNF